MIAFVQAEIQIAFAVEEHRTISALGHAGFHGVAIQSARDRDFAECRCPTIFDGAQINLDDFTGLTVFARGYDGVEVSVLRIERDVICPVAKQIGIKMVMRDTMSVVLMVFP